MRDCGHCRCCRESADHEIVLPVPQKRRLAKPSAGRLSERPGRGRSRQIASDLASWGRRGKSRAVLSRKRWQIRQGPWTDYRPALSVSHRRKTGLGTRRASLPSQQSCEMGSTSWPSYLPNSFPFATRSIPSSAQISSRLAASSVPRPALSTTATACSTSRARGEITL